MLKVSLSLILLMVVSGCSTRYELIHEPLICRGNPVIGIDIPEAEAEKLSWDAANQIYLMHIAYRERINIICNDIEKHNRAHQ